MPATGLVALDKVFGSIAGSLIVQQQRMDAEYLVDLKAFEQCFRQAGFGPLAGQFISARLIVQKSQVECEFSLRQTSETTFAVRVLNRVAATRYFRSRSFETRVQMTVQRIPLAPAAK